MFSHSRSLVKRYTKRTLKHIKGPITVVSGELAALFPYHAPSSFALHRLLSTANVVPTAHVYRLTGKNRRLTFIECNNDMNSMIDVGKIADLVRQYHRSLVTPPRLFTALLVSSAHERLAASISTIR